MLRISGSGLTDDSTPQQDEGKVLYVMHPDCAFEEM